MTTAELTSQPGVRRDPFPRPWTAAEFEKARGLGVFDGRAVELIDSQIVERIDGQLRPFVFTRKEYYALDIFFIDQRVELINGEILQMARMNPPHAKSVYKSTKALERVFADGFVVRCQLSLDLGLTTEPQPDVAVVEGSIDDYGDEHPHTAVLVVEVSDTTFDFDSGEKASLYAAAGIADYWIVDLANRRVMVCRDPQPAVDEPHHYRYAALSPVAEEKFVAPLAASSARVPVADLLT